MVLSTARAVGNAPRCVSGTASARLAGAGRIDGTHPLCDRRRNRLPTREVPMSSGPPTSPRVFLPGDWIGTRFRVKSSAGGGAFGDVYRCSDRLSDTDVAVKVLRFEGAGYEVAWRREMAMLRSFEAPGIVSLIDEGSIDGFEYLAMPFIDGAPFPGPGNTPRTWTEIREPVLTLLNALHYVHSVHIFHRDLKPSNVIVDAAGMSHVLDFGIAWASGAALSQMYGLGTPAYTSPEQARGAVGDVRSDLYAVGTMVWEALTGRWPFAAKSVKALLAQKTVMDAPSLSTVWPDGDADVIRAVDALLQLEPNLRPASALEAIALFPGSNDAIGPLDTWLEVHGTPREARCLESLFDGEERILRQRSLRADALWRECGESSARLNEVVTRWVRGGLAWWDGGQLVISERAYARLTRLRSVVAPEHDERATLSSGAPGATLVDSAELDETLPAELAVAGQTARLTRSLVAAPVSIVEHLLEGARELAREGDALRSVQLAESALMAATNPEERLDALKELALIAALHPIPATLELALFRVGMYDQPERIAEHEWMLRSLKLVLSARHADVDVDTPLHTVRDLDVRSCLGLARGNALMRLTPPDRIADVEREWLERDGRYMKPEHVATVQASFRYVAGEFGETARLRFQSVERAERLSSLVTTTRLAVGVTSALDDGDAALSVWGLNRLVEHARGATAEVAATAYAAEQVLRSRLYGQTAPYLRDAFDRIHPLVVHGLHPTLTGVAVAGAARANERAFLESCLPGRARRHAIEAQPLLELGADAMLAFVGFYDEPTVAALVERAIACAFPRARLQALALLAERMTPRQRVAATEAWASARATCHAAEQRRYELVTFEQADWLWNRSSPPTGKEKDHEDRTMGRRPADDHEGRHDRRTGRFVRQRE